MSEYQYYEFQAIDRPLTEREMRTLRGYSTRATITPTRFMNHYEWGSFKGNPAAWMEKYFDAFLYVANWGTHELMLRLPHRVLDPKQARQYLLGDAASVRVKGDQVILEFHSESEDGDGWDDDGSGWLSSLIPIRADMASGDLRALYLAWLLSVQLEEADEDTLEPPVPSGLGQLAAPLKAFADFLRIDEDLIAVAVEHSAESNPDAHSKRDLARWISAMPEAEKTDLLVRVASGEEAPLRAELLRRFRAGDNPSPTPPSRTVAELRAAAEKRAEERRRRAAERAAREKERRAREETATREKYLRNLAKREPAVWNRVGALIAAKKPADYDEAVRLLQDLRISAHALGVWLTSSSGSSGSGTRTRRSQASSSGCYVPG